MFNGFCWQKQQLPTANKPFESLVVGHIPQPLPAINQNSSSNLTLLVKWPLATTTTTKNGFTYRGCHSYSNSSWEYQTSNTNGVIPTNNNSDNSDNNSIKQACARRAQAMLSTIAANTNNINNSSNSTYNNNNNNSSNNNNNTTNNKTASPTTTITKNATTTTPSLTNILYTLLQCQNSQ